MHVRVSQHAGQRMNQRGISRRLVDFALAARPRRGQQAHPRPQRVAPPSSMRSWRSCGSAKRALDKGGIAVVEGGATLVTTYNLATRAPPAERRAPPCLKHYY